MLTSGEFEWDFSKLAFQSPGRAESEEHASEMAWWLIKDRVASVAVSGLDGLGLPSCWPWWVGMLPVRLWSYAYLMPTSVESDANIGHDWREWRSIGVSDEWRPLRQDAIKKMTIEWRDLRIRCNEWRPFPLASKWRTGVGQGERIPLPGMADPLASKWRVMASEPPALQVGREARRCA